MIGSILLIAVLVCALIEILIGVKRGIAFTGVRIVLWALGTLVAVLVSKKLATAIVLKLVAAYGYSGASISEITVGALSDAGLGNFAQMLGVPVAGLALSAVVPFVFAVLFILMKLLTWIVFLIIKAVIKKSKAAKYFTERPVWSKIAGGVVGGVAAVIACAIIASPVSGLVKTIDDSGAVDSIFHLAEMVTEDTDTLKNLAEQSAIAMAVELEKKGLIALDGAVPVYADAAVAPVAYEELNLEDLRALYDSLVKSPAAYICRYTGGEGIAMAIYRNSSTISTADVGADDYREMNYNFPDTVAGFLGISNKIDDTATLIHDGAGFCPEVVNSVEEVIFYVLDTDLITSDDKLYMLNSSVTGIQNGINELFGLGEQVEFVKAYDSFDDFKQDIDNVFTIARVVSDVEWTNGGSIADIDVNRLLTDVELMKDFIHTTLKLSVGADIIAAVVNAKVSELTDGALTKAVSAESILAAGEENVVLTFTAVFDLNKYMGRRNLSDEEFDEVVEKAALIEEYGVVLPEAVETVKNSIIYPVAQ